MLIIAVVLLITGRVIEYREQSRLLNFQQLTQRAQDNLHLEGLAADQELERWLPVLKSKALNQKSINALIGDNEYLQNLYIFIYENKSLVFWTDNRIKPDHYDLVSWQNNEVVFFRQRMVSGENEGVGQKGIVRTASYKKPVLH